MSFSDEPTGYRWQALGCLVFGLIGLAASMVGLFIASLGDCAPGPDGYGCENDGLEKFLWFPGVPISFALLGVGLLWLFSQSRK